MGVAVAQAAPCIEIFLKIGNGGSVVSLSFPYLGTVVEGVGMVWFEANGLGVILQRALQVPFSAPRNAPVYEGIGIVGLKADGLVVILQRALQVAFVAPRIAPVYEGLLA